jgi:hypothetical protein
MAATATRSLTLVEPGPTEDTADVAHALDVAVDGDRVHVATGTLEAALGWELKPEGLCRGEVCRPVRDRSAVEPEPGRLDLAAVAAALGRPLVLDLPADGTAGTGFLGEAAATRAAVLRTRMAPDFELPDLDGRPHRLSDERGKKVFLVFWASW